jgi:DNA transposition AAA+ family ATPase
MEDIRKRVQVLLERRPDIEPHVLGSYTHLAPSSVRHILSGAKEPGVDATRELERVVRLVEAGEILQAGQEAVTITERSAEERPRVRRARDFYVTDTVRRIGQVLTYCSDQAAIGVVSGDYGVGKTESLRYWRTSGGGRKVNHVVFEFDEFSSRNVVDFVNQLAELLDVEGNRSHNMGGKTFRTICAALCDAPALLIFDQCETVQPRIFQVIRQVWDRTRHAGVGVVLLGSPLLVERMRGSRMKDVGALTSRVGIWAALRGVQKEEAADIVRKEGVSLSDDEAFGLLWKMTAGSMRRLMAVTDLLTSKHQGKPVTTKTVEGVAGMLWGLSAREAA